MRLIVGGEFCDLVGKPVFAGRPTAGNAFTALRGECDKRLATIVGVGSAMHEPLGLQYRNDRAHRLGAHSALACKLGRCGTTVLVQPPKHISLRWSQIADATAFAQSSFEHAQRGAQFGSQDRDVG